MKKLLILFAFIATAFSGFSQDYCEDIIIHRGEFDEKVVATTPTTGVYLIRIDEDDMTHYFAGLQITADAKRVKGKLITLNLEDGTKILVKADLIEAFVDYDPDNYTEIYYYSTFIGLTEEQMKMLANRKLISFKIGSLSCYNSASEDLMWYAKCLIENR